MKFIRCGVLGHGDKEVPPIEWLGFSLPTGTNRVGRAVDHSSKIVPVPERYWPCEYCGTQVKISDGRCKNCGGPIEDYKPLRAITNFRA